VRVSITSLNLWNTEKLERRSQCIKAFLRTWASDIFCFQEIRPELIRIIDEAIPEYARIDGKEEGWRMESNIYFRRSLFSLDSCSYHDLDMPEPLRGLFTVTLNAGGTIFSVSTVHLTHQGNADELRTGMPYRHDEALRIGAILNSMDRGMAGILTGDFNDPIHPEYILERDTEYRSVFSALGIPAPVTFPCPFLSEENHLVEAIDKIMFRDCRPLMACSPHFYLPGEVLSDHYPVSAMFEIPSN
jgi:Endonuclease/Exonuclease/phosphatase family.